MLGGNGGHSGVICEGSPYRTSMARGKKYSNKLTLKEARPEKIQTLYNQRGNQTGSIQTRASRRIGHTRCFQ